MKYIFHSKIYFSIFTVELNYFSLRDLWFIRHADSMIYGNQFQLFNLRIFVEASLDSVLFLLFSPIVG